MRNCIARALPELEHRASSRPDYVFGDEGQYRARVAGSECDRRRAWALAFEAYREKGYVPADGGRLWYGLHDALPDTTTFLVERRGVPVGALSVVFDSPLGLPADELYSNELAALRSVGRRICEGVSFASHGLGLREGVEVTRHLIKLAYLTACKIEMATDFLFMVNPRHVRYYCRVLSYSRVGEQRACAKVGGAPAVLLKLDLETAAARYREKYGEAEDSLYRFFEDPRTEPGVLEFVRSQRRPFGKKALVRYFVREKGLLPQARPDHRKYIEDCYPGYDLVATTSGTRQYQPA